MLRLERIAKRRGGAAVLNDLTLQVNAGDCLAISAASNSAASTFIRVVATLSQPDSGLLLIDGIDAVRDPFRARQRLAYVSPNGLASRPGMRLRDAWRTTIAGRSTATTATTGTFLDQCGLDLDTSIDRLPLSTRRCAAVAMALDSHSPLALLEMPFSGLDDEAAQRLVGWMASVRQAGITIVATVDAPRRAPWASSMVHLES